MARAPRQARRPHRTPHRTPYLTSPVVTHEAIAAQHGDNHKYTIAFAVVLASLLQVIDSSIVNVALPDMMGNLGASLDEIAWVTTGYILASVIVMPLTGWLSGFFGRKRYFVGSIILFTASSFFCGSSHTLGTLIFWRIVQGLGGGALLTVSQAVLLEAFPLEEAGTAMALFGVGVMVGPTIGPTLGGWITDNYNWPWIFYINVPLGFLAAFMIGTYVHDTVERVKSKAIDYAGILLLIAAVGSTQYLLEHGQREDWFDSRLITSLAVVGVVGSIVLVWHELRVKNPVIEFRVLRHRQMWVGTILGVVMGVGLYAASFTLPVFLQNNLHMTAEQTGMILLPGAASTAVSMAITGRITGKIDPRILIASGAVIFSVAMFDLSAITSLSGRYDFFWPLILRGIGLGMMFVPLTTVTLAELDRSELPSGTGLYNFFRQLGGSFGIAGIATMVAHNTARYHANITEHITTTDPASLARVAGLTRGFIAKGADAVTAHQRALAILDRQIGGQASVIAYGQTYTLAAVLILMLIPLLVLVRNTKGSGGHDMIME
jgi:DHA2 family multidrug resistance protein